MSQLEQIKSIIAKEIKTKQWVMERDQLPRTRYYCEGSLAALRYIKYMIDKLEPSTNEQN